VLNTLRKVVTTPSVSTAQSTIDEQLLDVEYMTACAKEADPSVTLASVRQILAKIPGSLANDIIAERDERFQADKLHSPLDISGMDLPISTQEIIELIREEREPTSPAINSQCSEIA
jgi:hypothetical protein